MEKYYIPCYNNNNNNELILLLDMFGYLSCIYVLSAVCCLGMCVGGGIKYFDLC